MRIVSLLPSATEILCGLGLQESLVGVTHECDYPDFVKGLPKVTKSRLAQDATSQEIDRLVKEQLHQEKSLYRLDHEAISWLKPDLIVTQTLCDVCAVSKSDVDAAVRSLESCPGVLNLVPLNLADVLSSIVKVGIATSRTEQAQAYVAHLQQRMDAIRACGARIVERPRVALLEWIDPLFSAGHWNPELIQLAGGQPVLGEAGSRSRQIEWNVLVDANPDVLVIACCGFDISRALQDIPLLKQSPYWETMKCVENDRVYLVDGSAYFNRPGPRLVDSLEILSHLIHPGLHEVPCRASGFVRVTT